MSKYLTYILLCCLTVFFSCRNSGEHAPDVSGIEVTYKAYPFYKDFSALDTAGFAEGLTALKTEYPHFLDFYLDTVVGFHIYGDYVRPNEMLPDFFRLKDYRQLMDTVNKAFPNTTAYDELVKKSFRYIKYYDPSFALPEHIYYFVSGLNGMAVVYQNEKSIGVGLDMFLGRNFAPYQSVGIPEYATIRMTPENIPAWIIKVIYEDRFPYEYEDRTLLDMMIQKGKELFFLKKVAPYLDEAVVLGYTPAQAEWCSGHEAMIYNFFVQNNLLFDRSLQKTMRFVTDGPTTTGMPSESPGNTGSYIGLRIVEAYVDKHNVSLKELLAIDDAQKILNGARYKPILTNN